MALDHFVPQVHLKKFNSPALNGRMYALRKSDMKSFQPPPKDVCRIEDWSTNSYSLKDRILEEFLRTIEPKYSWAIENLKAGNYNQETIYVIAGFADRNARTTAGASSVLSWGGMLATHRFPSDANQRSARSPSLDRENRLNV